MGQKVGVHVKEASPVPASTRAAAVLVASCAPNLQSDEVVSRVRLQRASGGSLSPALLDVAKVHEFLSERARVEVRRVFAATTTPGTSPDEVLSEMQDLFADDSIEVAVIYYSGNGAGAEEHSGDWCFKAAHRPLFISWQQVIDLWDARPNCRRPAKLFLAMDSCHSGAWAQLAGPRDDVCVQAACRASEKATQVAGGGVFTQRWLAGLHGLQDVSRCGASPQLPSPAWKRQRSCEAPDHCPSCSHIGLTMRIGLALVPSVSDWTTLDRLSEGRWSNGDSEEPSALSEL
mmetsp:Transcript_63269/g.135984  ORF Transcript_63269/g.135984 Transcript_63269/m.135984 type:complete len:289 (+) Transcript_63269:95-961(+)